MSADSESLSYRGSYPKSTAEGKGQGDLAIDRAPSPFRWSVFPRCGSVVTVVHLAGKADHRVGVW